MSERQVTISVVIESPTGKAVVADLAGDMAALRQAATDSGRAQADGALLAAKAMQQELSEAGRLRKEIDQVAGATKDNVKVAELMAQADVEAAKASQERAIAIREVGVEAARTVAAVVNLGERATDVAKSALESGHGLAIAGASLKVLAGAAGLAGPAFVGLSGALGVGAGLAGTLLIAGAALKATEAVVVGLIDAVKVGTAELDEMAAAGHRLEAVFSGDVAAIGQMNTMIDELDGAQPFFEDDQIANAAAMARMFNLTSGEIDTLLPAMVDMAAVMDADLGEAINRVGMGLQGSTRGLKAWGIDVEEGADRAEVFAAVLAKAGMFHVEAGRKAEDHAGKVMAIEKAFKNAKTSIAELFIPVVQLADNVGLGLARTAEQLAGGFENMGKAARNSAEDLDKLFHPRHAEWTVDIKVNGGNFKSIDDFAQGWMLDFAKNMKLPAAGPGPVLGPTPQEVTRGLELVAQAEWQAEQERTAKAVAIAKARSEKANQAAQAEAADQVRVRQELNRSLALAQLEGFAKERLQAQFHHIDRLTQAHITTTDMAKLSQAEREILTDSRKKLWHDVHAIDVKEGDQATKDLKTAGEKQAKAFLDGLKGESAAFKADAIMDRILTPTATWGPQEAAEADALVAAHKDASSEMWDFYIDRALDAYGQQEDAAKEASKKAADAAIEDQKRILDVVSNVAQAMASAIKSGDGAGLGKSLLGGTAEAVMPGAGGVVGGVIDISDALLRRTVRPAEQSAVFGDLAGRRAAREARASSFGQSEPEARAQAALREEQAAYEKMVLVAKNDSELRTAIERDHKERVLEIEREKKEAVLASAEVQRRAAEEQERAAKQQTQGQLRSLARFGDDMALQRAEDQDAKLLGNNVITEEEFAKRRDERGVKRELEGNLFNLASSVTTSAEAADRLYGSLKERAKPNSLGLYNIDRKAMEDAGVTNFQVQNELWKQVMATIGHSLDSAGNKATSRKDDKALTPGSSPQNPIHVNVGNFKELWASEPAGSRYRATRAGTTRAPQSSPMNLSGNVRTPGSGNKATG